MGRHRRRRDRGANVRTLPTSKTHRYWDRFRDPRPSPFDPTYDSRRRRINEMIDDFEADDPPMTAREAMRSRAFRREQLEKLERQRLQTTRLAVNINRPWTPPPARYGPQRFFTSSTVAAAAIAAGQGVKNDVPVCVERQSRKEIMFATGKAGRVGQKSPIWTQKSRIRCK